MTNKSKIGWGVIGACGIAKRRTIPEGLMPASNADLAAVMDVNQEGAQQMVPEDIVSIDAHQAVRAQFALASELQLSYQDSAVELYQVGVACRFSVDSCYNFALIPEANAKVPHWGNNELTSMMFRELVQADLIGEIVERGLQVV